MQLVTEPEKKTAAKTKSAAEAAAKINAPGSGRRDPRNKRRDPRQPVQS